MLPKSLLACSFVLVGCANITATPLMPDGTTPVAGAARGFRYYTPRPYLLVTRLPSAAPGQSGGNGQSQLGTGTGSGGAAAAKNTTDTTTSAPSSPASGSDASFIAQNSTYVAKVVYFPDYEHPMSVSMSSGLFGTTSMQLTLDAGWNLTSVSANSDNSKLADVVTAAVQAIAGGATGGASTAASAAKKTGSASAFTAGGDIGVLAPGLYAFEYKPGTSQIASVCAISTFSSTGVNSNTPGACGLQVPRPSINPGG